MPQITPRWVLLLGDTADRIESQSEAQSCMRSLIAGHGLCNLKLDSLSFATWDFLHCPVDPSYMYADVHMFMSHTSTQMYDNICTVHYDFKELPGTEKAFRILAGRGLHY